MIFDIFCCCCCCRLYVSFNREQAMNKRPKNMISISFYLFASILQWINWSLYVFFFISLNSYGFFFLCCCQYTQFTFSDSMLVIDTFMSTKDNRINAQYITGKLKCVRGTCFFKEKRCVRSEISCNSKSVRIHFKKHAECVAKNVQCILRYPNFN